MSSETPKKIVFLPFPKEFQVPIPKEPQQVPVYPFIIPESCAGKIVIGGIMGAVLGVGLGLFSSFMGDVNPIQIINGREVPQAPLREQVRAGFKSTLSRAGSYSKQFGVYIWLLHLDSFDLAICTGILSALFGGVECLVEKQRAKHDVWNPVVSGCVVGATMAAKAGPTVTDCHIFANTCFTTFCTYIVA